MSSVDKRLTVADLSPDQKEAHDSIRDWLLDSNRLPIITMGGYAGCLSGETTVQYSRGTRVGHRPITLRD